MATAAAAQKPTFIFTLEEGITIPEDINETAARPNVLVDEFFTPALAKVLQDEKAEPTMFFPVAYFQQGASDWATKNGKTPKELSVSDARQKIKDGFKKFQEKKQSASVVEILLANRTGKEGDPKATVPGVRVWLRMKKK